MKEMIEPQTETLDVPPSFDIHIVVDGLGRMNIKHPENYPGCIYYLELAKAMLIQKSIAPRDGIIEARNLPNAPHLQ